MKILIVSNLYPPNAVGGYERLCARIAEELAKRGHALSVITSNWGTARLSAEPFPVERSLELLNGKDGIYSPFAGGPAARDEIVRRNVERLSRKIATERPDAIFVGNLYFFDASILSALQEYRRRTVYLLTDVWRLHFADPRFVQEHFREHVFELQPGTKPLVPPDPPRLVLELLASAAELFSHAAQEGVGHRCSEEALAKGRSAFQYTGTCHLCGPSTFLVRLASAGKPQVRAETSCAICGFDGPARGALQALDLLASPEPGARTLAVSSDTRLRAFLEQRHPLCAVVAALSQAPEGEQFQNAVCLTGAADELADLRSRILPGGTVVLGEDFAQASPGMLIELARSAGFSEAAAALFWSIEHGYLGRDYTATRLRT
jgi:hypothetical protein